MAVWGYIGILLLAVCVLSPEFSDGQSVKRFSVDAKSITVYGIDSHAFLIDMTNSSSMARCLLDCHYTGGCMSVKFDPNEMTCSTFNVTTPEDEQILNSTPEPGTIPNITPNTTFNSSYTPWWSNETYPQPTQDSETTRTYLRPLFAPLTALILVINNVCSFSSAPYKQPTPFDSCDNHTCPAGERCMAAKTRAVCLFG